MSDLHVRSRHGLVTGLLLALLLLAPLLGGGVVLARDMVFVPHLPLGGHLLGLGGVPRAVPSDLLVALGSRVLPVGWLQDLVLAAIVVGGAWGAARLVPATTLAGPVAAAVAYGWSPYLHERLLLGQWALLVGWAVLPWAVRSALAWRQGESGWPAVAALAVSALGGASAVLLVGLALVVCGRPVRALAATAVLSLPWAVPGALQAISAGDPNGVAAFAARSDTPLGVVGSLLTGGGVWARAVVPPGRSAGTVVAVAVLLVAAAGVTRVPRRLLVAGGLGLLVALLGRLPGAADALRWAVVHVPAAGLLRDGQKWLAPLVLAAAVAFACGTERLLSKQGTHPGVRRAAAALLVLAPLAALPGAAWAESGRLRQSDVPAAWQHLPQHAHGRVLVLPWTLYRAFGWEGGRTVLDPATKLLRDPVVDDDLPLTTGDVEGEDPVAARLDARVTSGEPLLASLQGERVTQVLLERGTRGFDPAVAARQTQGLEVVWQEGELTLLQVPGNEPAPAVRHRWVVLLGDGLALAFAVAALLRARRSRAVG